MKLKGWDKVFKFTYLQMLRSKPYKISTIIFVLVIAIMLLGLNFLPGLLAGIDSSETSDNTESLSFGVEKIYISDQSGITPPVDFSFLAQIGVEVNMISPEQVDEVTSEVKQSNEAEVLIEITRDELRYNILVSRPESDELISSSDCAAFANTYIAGAVWSSHIESLGVPHDLVPEAAASASTQVTIAGETPKNELAGFISSMLPMVTSLLLFLFIFLYAQLTASSIAMEKTSRVMETLLTSVKPLAVILGKVLGMGLASFTQFMIFAVAGFGISAIVAPLGAIGEVLGSVENADPEMAMIHNAVSEAFSNFNLLSIVWLVVIFILGFLFFSLLAGLFGSTVSRMEDLQAAMTPVSLIGVLGFYLAYISPAFTLHNDGVNIVEKISYYLPISSPFALPGAIISGQMSSAGAAVAVLVLAACDVLMLMFVSRVYEAVILHTGNRISVGAMFKLARQSK